jgi:hypothetical protein
MELDHFLTRYGLIHPEVSSMVILVPPIFGAYFLSSRVIFFKRPSVYTSYPTSSVVLYFVQDWVYIISFAVSVFVLYSVQVNPAVFIIHFISAVVILAASLALMVQIVYPIIAEGIVYNNNNNNNWRYRHNKQ